MTPGDELSDPEHPGLRVRCTSSAKVFFYRYRLGGGLKEIKLGEFGAMTLAAARTELSKQKLDREKGIDPQAEKRKKRLQQTQARQATRQAAYTVADLVEEYVNENLSKQKRGYEGERMLRKELLPKLGHRPASAITRRELQEEVMQPVMKRSPRVATYLLSRIRCAYAHAADDSERPSRLPEDFVSPALGIKGVKGPSRERAFSNAELATFLKWLPSSPFSRSVREACALVLLTGCRSGEVVAARWRDIDLEGAIWTIPGTETKNGKTHKVMLPTQAVELLRLRQGSDKVFVFPSSRPGHHIRQKALGLAQYAARHGADAERSDPIEKGWTVHDLRRTVATGLAGLKSAGLNCPRVVQDRILNHVDGSVSAIYDRYPYDDEAREWLQKWADYMTALISSKVVAIDSARVA